MFNKNIIIGLEQQIQILTAIIEIQSKKIIILYEILQKQNGSIP